MKSTDYCNKIMDAYLMLDKGEKVPFEVTLHLLTCRKCRKQVQLLKACEKITRAPLEIQMPIDDSSIEAVMAKIDPSYKNSKNPISIAKWIIGGITMILFMMAFRLSSYSLSNKGVLISFYILFALCVTAYCSMFIGTNMDFFIKMMETNTAKKA